MWKQQMRGRFASNVVIAFGLCVGGMLLAGVVTQALFPKSAHPAAYPIALLLCLSPFAVFMWWALETATPLWMQFVSWIVTAIGFASVFAAMRHFGFDDSLWNSAFCLVFVFLWHAVFARWFQ